MVACEKDWWHNIWKCSLNKTAGNFTHCENTNYGKSKWDSNVMIVLIKNVAFSNTNKASDTINEETPFLFFGDNGDHSWKAVGHLVPEG